jgi:hypothetical protein
MLLRFLDDAIYGDINGFTQTVKISDRCQIAIRLRVKEIIQNFIGDLPMLNKLLADTLLADMLL